MKLRRSIGAISVLVSAAGGCFISFQELPEHAATGGGAGGASSSEATTGPASTGPSTGGGGHGTCSDGIRNDGETDVDCGGPCPSKCALGERCAQTSDCVAFACIDGLCQTAHGIWTSIAASPDAPGVADMISGFDGDHVRILAGFYHAWGFIQATFDTTDSYTFDGVGWPSTPTQPSPPLPGRWGAASTTRDASILVFGGQNPASLNDAWVFADGPGTWSPVPASHPPAPRAYAAMGAAPGLVVVYGGVSDSNAPLDETWELDLAHETWSQVATATSPGAPVAPAMVYDPAHDEFVLFGGSDGTTVHGETWVYAHATRTWQPRLNGPDARYLAGVTYDPIRRRVVVTGGQDDQQLLTDTWEWDGAGWTKTACDAPRRSRFGFAFDPGRRFAVLVGGTTDGGALTAATSTYHVVGNACSGPDQCHTKNCVDGVCCETTACGPGEACNLPTSPGVCAKTADAPDAGSCPP